MASIVFSERGIFIFNEEGLVKSEMTAEELKNLVREEFYETHQLSILGVLNNVLRREVSYSVCTSSVVIGNPYCFRDTLIFKEISKMLEEDELYKIIRRKKIKKHLDLSQKMREYRKANSFYTPMKL